MSPHDLPHRRRVLVVEDSLVNQKVLTFMLETQGYEVIVAINGKEGVEKFCEQAFDVVCMDVQMPVMDGLAADSAYPPPGDRHGQTKSDHCRDGGRGPRNLPAGRHGRPSSEAGSTPLAPFGS